MITHKQLKIKLEQIKDPLTKDTLGKRGYVKNVLISPDGIVDVKLTYPEEKGTSVQTLKREIAKLVKIDLGFKGLRVEIIPPKEESDEKYHYLAILSGKGGVGKSTITSELAKALTKLGKKVGIIDADIYGATIPDYFNVETNKIYGTEEKITPVLTDENIEVISSRFLVEENQSITLRSPVLRGVLDYFFNKVAWSSDIDIILIDMPPGTGDVLLDVFDYTKGNLDTLLITTPDLNASKVALKSGFAVNNLKGKVLGVIENMSYLLDTKAKIFGSGGGKYVSETLEIPLLYEIPLGDLGKNNLEKDFKKLAEKVLKIIGDKNVW